MFIQTQPTPNPQRCAKAARAGRGFLTSCLRLAMIVLRQSRMRNAGTFVNPFALWHLETTSFL